MAPPRAADNFGQKQSITTAIRNICEYYPPNTCLRELLQNADDAGATEIEYVLDTKTYKGEPLLSNGLKDSQGPALLARNNSVFRDEDFSGLSTVGDSVKAKDPATTGKFGQGFNATYHWSDGPWIWSRNWLLILDPHEWWSQETGQAGGPRWDVVENCDSPEIQNHLQTFNEYSLNKNRTLDQTVIRIPLRTSTQAARSKLFNTKVEIKQIRQALEEFSEEIKEGGLLFLKHIRRVIIRVDSDVMLETEILEMGEEDTKIRQQLPRLFKGLYASEAAPAAQDMSLEFELHIRRIDKHGSLVNRYMVQHVLLRSSDDEKLDKWGREHKLFPWVAIAAPLKDDYDTQRTHGRLFTTLRLPMPTNLPLHIHGLFSIAPDRGRLSFTRDLGDMPTKWNDFMFTRCVTSAWLKLLMRRSSTSWREERFAFWPRVNFAPVEMWDKLDDRVIDMAINLDCKVWNACHGDCVDFQTGFFAITDQAEIYESALAQAKVPAVYSGESFVEKVKQRAVILGKTFNSLTPSNVRHFLRSNGIPVLSSVDASLMLEFSLLDALKSQLEGKLRCDLYQDLQDIPLWPTLNGAFSASGSVHLLLPRDNAEMELFSNSRAHITLDISRLRPAIRKLLLNDIEFLTAVMRFRGLDDLKKDWPESYPIAHDRCSQGWVVRPSHLDQRLGEVWDWIFERRQKGQLMSPSHSGNLWLVPVKDFGVRQYVPGENGHPILLIEQDDSLFRPLASMLARLITAAVPVFETKALSSEAVQFLRKDKGMRSDMNCTTIDDVEKFVSWLVAGKAFFSELSKQNSNALLDHLERLTRDHLLPRGMSSTLRSHIRQLPLFNKISCVSPFSKIDYVMCSLDADANLYAAPANLPSMPEIPNAAFFEPQSTAEDTLVQRLQTLEKISKRELFTRHFLPWMVKIPTAVDHPLSSVKQALVHWLFKKPLSPPKAWSTDVFIHPIIPLPIQNGQRMYRCLDGMIDPSSELAQLYEAEERLFPCPNFFHHHKDVLLSFGILSKPVWYTPLERIRYFSERGDRIDDLLVERLLKLPILTELANSGTSVAEIRRLKWIPGTSTTGQPVLFAPNECRGDEDTDLVDMVFGSTNIRLRKTSKWKQILGWDQDISMDILVQQLDSCLLYKDYQRANVILRRMQPGDCSALMNRPWILGRSGEHFPPARVFYPGNELNRQPLSPFLDQIEAQFAKDHKHLLTALKIQPEPSIKDLQEVNNALKERSEDQLDLQGVHIAIAVLEIATRLGHDFADLLIPDTSSRLRSLAEVVHGDPLVLGDNLGFNLTHPKISLDLIQRLKIDDSRERALRLAFEMEGDYAEDYNPCESFETTISDTLGRYSIADTFNEFLANADDAGASKIVWIVDECDEGPYASSSLLSKELQPLQGPSVLVYNDAVFSQQDFDGFKDIGQGGKKGDDKSTGMFGRGAQSLYHFTDVPMLVSNDAFVVLDPQKQVLPTELTRRNQRRVGIKMPLTSVNRLAPDQVTPFNGLYGFDPNEANFNGTIFRLPLGAIGAQSSLRETQQTVDLVHVRRLLQEYLNTARTALLFLRHVDTIEFHIRGQPNPEWSVKAQRPQSADSDVLKQIKITTARLGFEVQKDTWCVGLKIIKEIPPGLTRPGKGAQKQTECGVAACLHEDRPHKADPKVKMEPKIDMSLLDQFSNAEPATRPRIFCRLPTSHNSELPISFHGSFAVTGDRRSFPVEDSHEYSKWNLWLLQECLSTLYFEAILHLAPRLGPEAFKYWPAQEPTTTLSGILSKAFWEKLGKPDSCSKAVLPIVAQTVKEEDIILLNASQKVTDLPSARFDFLPKYISEKLQHLLIHTTPLLIRPPQRLWPYFRGSSVSHLVQQVDVEYLCQVFKIETNCKLLERYVADMNDKSDQEQVLAFLLRTLVPRTKLDNLDTLAVLDQCRVVPRPGLSHPMGTLKWKPDSGARWNLLPNPEEEKLFGFAANTMVHNGLFPKPKLDVGTNVHHDPMSVLLQGNFNVRQMQLNDIGSLLARSDSPIAPSAKPENRGEWMLRFWEYVNLKFRSPSYLNETVDTLLSRSNLNDKAIYRTQCSQGWSYITPQEFLTKPYILQPLRKDHQKICEEIPGLCMIDPQCAPTLLQNQESDLDFIGSFKRLLRAIEILEKTANRTAKVLIGHALRPESKDVLRDLVLRHLESGAYGHQDSNAILRRLPIWRRFKALSSPPREHIAAEDAIFCQFGEMLTSWVKNLPAFVEPALVHSNTKSLERLGIRSLTQTQVWDKIKSDVPSDVKSKHSRQEYLEFIQYLSQWKLKVFGRIAPNGSSLMSEASSLYDHKDEIFSAAFREQKDARFLHNEMQQSTIYNFWLSLGLRARSGGAIKPEHYLECALALGRRWDPSLTTIGYEEDAKKVTSYLEFDGHQFRSWPNATWTRLVSIPMFQVMDVSSSELAFRRDRMHQMAQQATHRALEKTTHIDHKRILWSQSCFLQRQPGNFVYETLPQRGKPSVTKVFDHLQYLADRVNSISQSSVAEYLRDIQACYVYLQDNLDSSRGIPGIHRAKVWINLDTTQLELVIADALELCLTSTNLLCLNSPADPLPLKNAGKFLVAYEKLLTGLGCKTVVQPIAPLQLQSSDSREFSLVAAMAMMRRLRDQDQLVDVTFEAEGQKKPAHRLVLAAVSEYCRAQFAGQWGHLLQHQATIRIEDLRFPTVTQMIDFAYTGEFQPPEPKNPKDHEAIGNDLSMLLDLLDGTDRWLFQRLHDLTESTLISTTYVRLDTVEWVKERAESARATRLVKYCDEFFKENEQLVILLRDDPVEGE